MRRKLFGCGHAIALLACSLLGCATMDKDYGTGQAAAPAAPLSRTAAPATASTSARSKASIGSRWTLSERDGTLKAALQRWSETAGWRLVWELGVDYRIEASASIDGGFESAVGEVVKNMSQAEVPPKAIFYRSNQVVRIVPRGME